MCACMCVFVTHLVELLSQQAPLLCVGFAELLFVSDEERQFADGTIQQILRALLHRLTEKVCLRDQHSPRLTDGGQRPEKQEKMYCIWIHINLSDFS